MRTIPLMPSLGLGHQPCWSVSTPSEITPCRLIRLISAWAKPSSSRISSLCWPIVGDAARFHACGPALNRAGPRDVGVMAAQRMVELLEEPPMAKLRAADDLVGPLHACRGHSAGPQLPGRVLSRAGCAPALELGEGAASGDFLGGSPRLLIRHADRDPVVFSRASEDPLEHERRRVAHRARQAPEGRVLDDLFGGYGQAGANHRRLHHLPGPAAVALGPTRPEPRSLLALPRGDRTCRWE